jgi:hypothetical protein
MVSSGEYIIRESVVSKPGMLQMLHAINRGAVMKAHSAGGLIGGSGEMAFVSESRRSGGDEGGGNTTLHYHDNRALSAVDTHGLTDLLAQDSHAAGKLFNGLIRRGILNPRKMVR